MNNVIYISKRDEDVTCKIVKEMEVAVIIEYLTGSKAGQTTTISTGTLKRWWNKAEKPEAVTEPAKAEKPAKKSRKTSKKPEAVTEPDKAKKSVEFNLADIGDNFQILGVPSDKTCFRITVNGKTIAEIFVRKSFLLVCTKKASEHYTNTCRQYNTYKYYHKVTSTDDAKNILKEAV